MRFLTILIAFALVNLAVFAATNSDVAELLKGEKAPDGVLFEIVEGDSNFLDWAIPEVKKYTDQLRAKFPDLAVAVVTHGREQFALMKNKNNKKQKLHKRVKSLIEDDKISLHVCGTHASWNQVGPSEFLDFVDVASAAPAQINDYVALGYVVIRLEK